MMSKIKLFIIFFLCVITVSGQDINQNNSAKNNKISLKDFIETTEAGSDYKFFYLEEIINNINLDLNADQNDMISFLVKQLNQYNLKIYNDNDKIYIYKGKTIVAELPDYHKNVGDQIIEETDNGLTETERNYLKGKKIASTEILTVGNKKDVKEGKTCIVNGKVRDLSSGEPLIGVTVYIESLKIGAATDVDGQFSLALQPGKYKIIVNHVGMKEQEYFLQVYSSGPVVIDMHMELIEINEVTISANQFDNVRGMQMGYERITSKSMKEIPVVMGEKDVIKVAQLLPGVVNVGEGASGINVRGSSADQNMFYINKIPVYNTSHLAGFFTAFSPDIINNFALYKSNIPTRYGGRLASIFEITTRQGNIKKFFGQGGISPVTSHFSFEGPMVKEKSSFVVSWRSSYSDWILDRIKSIDIKDNSTFFYDATVGFNSEINKKNFIKTFFYRSFDKFSLNKENDYEYANLGASVIWKHIYSSSLNGDLSAVYSHYEFQNIDIKNVSEAFKHKYSIDQYEVKYDFNLILASNHQLEFGLNNTLYNIHRGEKLPYGPESIVSPISMGQDNGFEGALYISDEFKIHPRLNLLAGVRYSYYASLGPEVVNKYFDNGPVTVNDVEWSKSYGTGKIIKFYQSPEYRAALNIKTGKSNSIKVSYNKLQQYIFMLSNTIAISPIDQWKLADYNIEPPTCDQVSLGFYQDVFKNSVQISVEAYRKWIDNIVEFKDGADFLSPKPIETFIFQGFQNTKGVEFMLKKNSGKLTGWLSYTYSRSVIKVDGVEGSINNGKEYPSNYDRPHSLNFVSNFRMSRRVSISSNVVYASGRPITYPIAVYFSEGQPLVQYSERNKYRIPDYLRFDLSINVEGNLLSKKLAHSFWMINVYNVLGRDNIYSVFFENENNSIQGYKLMIFPNPIITISWNFKFGNYLSD